MQKCLCGSKECRGYIGINKKVEKLETPADKEIREDRKRAKLASASIANSKKRSHKRKNRREAETGDPPEDGEEDCFRRRDYMPILPLQLPRILKHRSYIRDSSLLLLRNYTDLLFGDGLSHAAVYDMVNAAVVRRRDVPARGNIISIGGRVGKRRRGIEEVVRTLKQAENKFDGLEDGFPAESEDEREDESDGGPDYM